MSASARQKFATKVDAELLRAVRILARNEGRQLQVLIEEALADLIEKRRRERPRSHVLAAYQASHQAFAPFYKTLAEWKAGEKGAS
jgi:predicted transcriptional regulator